MKSRPRPNTAEVSIWRHEEQCKSFQQHLQSFSHVQDGVGLICDSFSPNQCVWLPQHQPFLVFWCLLVFPSAGCPLCLSSRMRECRCSWKHLCMDLLEARCAEKGQRLKGVVRATERKAAGQGFPGFWNVSCSLGNSFTCVFWEETLTLPEARNILVLFQMFNSQCFHDYQYLWVICFLRSITKIFLSIWDTGIGKVDPRKKRSYLTTNKEDQWMVSNLV